MSVDYLAKYKFLKRKLKILVYEHEALTQELEKSQRKLLKVARDNSFLLDRLLHYEQVASDSPGDSDATLSSDSDAWEPPVKKKNSGSSSSVRTVKQEAADRKDTNEDKSEKVSKQSAESSKRPDNARPKAEEPSSLTANKTEEEVEIDVQMPSDEPGRD